MVRSNLSSRPFYNERLVTMAFVLVALIAVGLTAYNIIELKDLSAQRSSLGADITRDEQAALRVQNEAMVLQRSVDRDALILKAGQTREANNLIGERTFSWTQFFGVIEGTMPMDLHLLSVAPRVEKGDIRVTLRVISKRPEHLSAFIEALGKTGAFYDVFAHEQELNDDNLYIATVESFYLPPGEPRKPAKTAGKGRP